MDFEIMKDTVEYYFGLIVLGIAGLVILGFIFSRPDLAEIEKKCEKFCEYTGGQVEFFRSEESGSHTVCGCKAD